MYLERKGNTVHLLKKSSKPVPEMRKRRKIQLAGSPAQWNEHVGRSPSKSKQKPMEQKMEQKMSSKPLDNFQANMG